MSDDEILEYRFMNLHEFVKVARQNLNRNNWDYLIGVRRARRRWRATGWRSTRSASDRGCCAMCPTSTAPVPCSARNCASRSCGAPVGSLENFEPGGGATVAAATTEFGNGMILSSVSHPGMEKTAEAAGNGFKIYQLYVRGDEEWVDDHVRRAIDLGYDAFAFTVDTDSYSRRERDIAKRHERRRVRVGDARIYQAKFNWRDIERVRRKFNIR